MSTVKFTAKTEDAAISKAADELGISPRDVNYKIVSRTSGLITMLGGQSVTIEVTLGRKEEEAPPVVEAVRVAPAPPPLPEIEVEAPAGEPEAAPADLAAADKEPAPKKRSSRRGNRSRGRRSDEQMEEIVVDQAIFDEKIVKAQEILSGIVKIVGGEAEVRTAQKGPEIHVSIIGNLPEWLGRGQSRTVESLQFLANKIVNRFAPRYRVVILIEGQRDERLQRLEEAATELSRGVDETGEAAWIVPMNPRERRIVHLAVTAFPALETKSVGMGTGRRLCILKKGDKPPEEERAPTPETLPEEGPGSEDSSEQSADEIGNR